MGRGKQRSRRVKAVTTRSIGERAVDVTPERLAKGDHSEMVNPAEIDSSEQPIGLTRRFRSSHLDRLYRSGRLDWTQWYAGDWYRTTHARCGFEQSAIASYGERSTGGQISYGLARTEAQAQARMLWRQARAAWPSDMVGFMDRLLLRDDLPRYGGREAARRFSQIACALDAMAVWLSTPRQRSTGQRSLGDLAGDQAILRDSTKVIAASGKLK